VDAKPAELLRIPFITERVEKCRKQRESSTREATRRLADTPMLFGEIRQPRSDYIAMPVVSSESRRYIPIGFLGRDVIAGNKLFTIPNATRYHFGVLMSDVHMAWMRAVCGRLEMRYSYSNTIVYNNFPWPDATDAQKAEVEILAQGVLDARAKYPDSTLADMYGETTMPFHNTLLKAHRDLDHAVTKLYGFPVKGITEADRVAALMKMHQKLIGTV